MSSGIFACTDDDMAGLDIEGMGYECDICRQAQAVKNACGCNVCQNCLDGIGATDREGRKQERKNFEDTMSFMCPVCGQDSRFGHKLWCSVGGDSSEG